MGFLDKIFKPKTCDVCGQVEQGYGGLFFYRPQDLKVHNYSDQDRIELEKLISQLENGSMGFLPKDVIKDCHVAPLFKKQIDNPEVLDRENLVYRLERCFNAMTQTYKNSEFWISEVRGDQGIYIWDGEV